MEVVSETNIEVKEYRLSTQVKLELFIILAIMILSIFIPALKGIAVIGPIVYFLVENKLRNRTAKESGLTFAKFSKVLRMSWYFILLVGIVMQLFYSFMYSQFFPDVMKHVVSRVPLNLSDINIQLILSIIILAFGEEIAFRGLIQGRLNRLVPTWAAILLTSILFALMHLSKGAPSVVVLDLLSVFIDSLLFGIIFARTKNIFASSIGHILANTVALLSIYFFSK